MGKSIFGKWNIEMFILKNALKILAFLWCFFSALGCLAQTTATYPNKPIRIIVPVAAGGNVDIIARSLALELSKGLGQPVLVENRPSAASIVGTQLVSRSAPDGYTLLAHSSTFFSAPLISANAGYDPIKDFSAVSLTCKLPMFILVNPNLPARNLSDLVALAKANPGTIASASSGNGSTGHMALEVFSSRSGAKFLNVFYKGNAQAIVDIVSGQVPMMFDQVSTGIQQVRNNTLRPLAVTSLTRSPLLPDLPTVSESGYPGYEDVTLNLLLAPAGTPPEILNKLNLEVVKAFGSPELRSKFAERGIELATSSSPEEASNLVKSEVARLSKVVREAGIKPE